MNDLFSILLLAILAIITQHIVSWAGSILHEVGNEESKYAVFTFRDDRNMPMTTNILMNVCIPNVFMIFIFIFSRKYYFYNIEKHLLFYVITFFVYRMILICLILRRKEMYSILYEISMALVAILLAHFIINFFLSKETTLFITASELREELWIIILIILYQFFKQILDKKVLQNNVLTKGQISRYIINKFQKFYNKYNHLLVITPQNRYTCILLYSVMIFEDYNRGPLVRSFERLKTYLGKTATVGIMQVKSNTPLSDEDSIVQFYNWLEKEVGEYTQFARDEIQVRNLAWTYNNDDAYAQSVAYIFNCLYNYIDDVPKYRTFFCMRAYCEDIDSTNNNIELHPYTSIRCDDINTFCACTNSNTFINLAKGHYNIQDITQSSINTELNEVFDGKELIISGIENLYVHGNNSELVISSQYATVLSFKNCNHIILEHLFLGHFPNTGQCTGAVLQFENCKNITIKQLELYGCGTYGLIISNSDINIHNCKIHNCTHGGILLNETHCIIDDTEIYDCKDSLSSIIELNNSNTIMNNTTIHDCSSHTLIIESNNSSVICQNVLIKNCHATGAITNLANDVGITEQTNIVE